MATLAAKVAKQAALHRADMLRRQNENAAAAHAAAVRSLAEQGVGADRRPSTRVTARAALDALEADAKASKLAELG